MTVSIHPIMLCMRAPPTLTDDADNNNTEESNQDANSLPPLFNRTGHTDLTETTDDNEGTTFGISVFLHRRWPALVHQVDSRSSP